MDDPPILLGTSSFTATGWNGSFRDSHEFTDRLIPFIRKLPNRKFAIEIRNRPWLNAEFANLLRDHGIALELQDRSWMPSPSELKFDPITANWTYIRWLGDRKAIEAQTTNWYKIIVDRTEELSSWVDFCYETMKRGVLIYAYANNHFAGHGPATIEMFRSIWQKKGHEALTRPQRKKQRQSSPLLATNPGECCAKTNFLERDLCRWIESARTHRARACALPLRASDTTLRLIQP